MVQRLPLLLALACLLALAAVGPVAAQQPDSPWPQLGRDRHRSGNTPVVGPFQPVEKWRYDAGGVIIAGPVIAANGTVYVGADNGELHAVRPDGTRAWRFVAETTRPDGSTTTARRLTTPAIDDRGRVIFGADDGKVRALDPDGSLVWTFDTADPRGTGEATRDSAAVHGAPVLAQGLGIVVGADDERAYELWRDGDFRRLHTATDPVRAAPAQGPDGAVYFGGIDGRLHSADPVGAQRWTTVLDGAIEGGIAIGADGTIYVGTAAGTVYAINPADGGERWKTSVGSAVRAPVALARDGATIYAGADDGKLHALAATDGKARWTHQTGGAIRAQPTVGGNGTVYVPTGDSHLYVLGPDGTRLSVFKTGGGLRTAAALAADGTLYVGSEDRNLYALKEGAAATPTPVTAAPTATPAPPPTPTPTPLPTDRAAPLGAPDSLFYFETGHNVRGAFLTFFRDRGDLNLFGYPRTEELIEGGLRVQYFQRARMEHHPGLAGTPYEVQLTLLGEQATAARRPFPGVPPFESTEDRRFFPETGQAAAGLFHRFWEENGGLDVFGFPISGELQETLAGQPLTVQYFQRARFERHPEHAGTRHEVQLGLLGDEVLRARGWLP